MNIFTYYIIGITIFFVLCSTAVIFMVQLITHRHHLNDNQHIELKLTYLSRIIFQFIISIIFSLSFRLYTYFNNNYGNLFFITCGLFSIIWLLATGMSIKFIYYLIVNKIKYFTNIKIDHYFKNKKLLWTFCPMIYGILFSVYDTKVTFTIIAIVAGKYIWLDASDFYSAIDINRKINKMKNEFPVDYFLLKSQLVTMGYFLIWSYSLEDKIIIFNTNFSFLICFYVLIPIAFLIALHDSMNSYTSNFKEITEN